MTEGLPRRIDLKDLTNDPSRLTRMWVLQLIGQHDGLLPVSQLAKTIIRQLETVRQRPLRFSYSPHNSLGELLSGMSASGLVKKQGADGNNIVELTVHGQRLLTLLPPGIPEALGFESQVSSP